MNMFENGFVPRKYKSLFSTEHFYKSESAPGFPVAYLKGILPKWKKLKKGLSGQGSPLLLIISSSAVRSVNLNRYCISSQHRLSNVILLYLYVSINLSHCLNLNTVGSSSDVNKNCSQSKA